MFYNCLNITYIDLSNFNTSKVTDMRYMFCGCSNLEKINFGNINTSSVENMKALFYNCYKLTSIDLSNFNTSKVNDMSFMFYGCSNLVININTSSVKDINSFFYNCYKLTSIDLSNFYTSKVTDISFMFYGCSNLEKINLSNINTSSVENMRALFYNCSKLISIDLSNFDTSKVNNAGFMFSFCYNLIYLDLSNFNTLKINKVDDMFQDCKSLIYLNLYNFTISNSIIKDNFINGISPYTKYCINDIYTKEYLLGNSLISNCSDDCFKPNKKIDIINKKCKDSCINTKYEKDNICYKECKDNEEYPVLCEGNDCDNNYTNECFDKAPKGYYLDINDKIYKKCFNNCLYCYGPGNKTINNCIECNNNLIILNESKYNTNCFKKCEKYYYFDENNEYHCIDTCPEKYSKLIIEKNKCIAEPDTYLYKYDYNNTYYISEELNDEIISMVKELLVFNDTINNNVSYFEIQDKVLEKIQDILNNNFETTNIEEGNDIIINADKVSYTITTSSNQKNNKDNNISTIDLGECENKLKEKYNISKNSTLYIMKVDVYIDNILKIEYDVYYPFSSNILTKLDLSICKDTKIDLSIPINLPSDELDKYNKSSDIYNNICYTPSMRFRRRPSNR